MSEPFGVPTQSMHDGPEFATVEEARAAIGQRVGWRCEACGARPVDRSLLHAHHVVPKARGPIHSWGNVVLLCAACHYGRAHAFQRYPAVSHRSLFLIAIRRFGTPNRAFLDWTSEVINDNGFHNAVLENPRGY